MAGKSNFTKEDLEQVRELANLGAKVLKAKFGYLRDGVVQNVRGALDPDLRLAGRVRARYDALREAGFSHDEAVEYTGKSVNKATDTVLSSLSRTEDKKGGE